MNIFYVEGFLMPPAIQESENMIILSVPVEI